MSSKAAAGKPDFTGRHPFGPRVIGAVLPKVTRPAFRSAGPQAAQLMADWPLIVGPTLAAVTGPRRFSAGTLTLGCAGPVALELQHLATELIERINTHLGRAAVQRVRFVQEVRAPAAPARLKAVRPSPVVVDMPDGPLRDALAALGGALRAERDQPSRPLAPKPSRLTGGAGEGA